MVQPESAWETAQNIQRMQLGRQERRNKQKNANASLRALATGRKELDVTTRSLIGKGEVLEAIGLTVETPAVQAQLKTLGVEASPKKGTW